MAKYNYCCVQSFYVYKFAIIQPYFNFNECVTTQCLVAASSFSLFSVAILARLVMKISDIFSHRDKYLRHEQELFCK